MTTSLPSDARFAQLLVYGPVKSAVVPFEIVELSCDRNKSLLLIESQVHGIALLLLLLLLSLLLLLAASRLGPANRLGELWNENTGWHSMYSAT